LVFLFGCKSCRWLISPRSDFPLGYAVRFGRRFRPRFVCHTLGFAASHSSGSISILLLSLICFCCARSCSPFWLLLASVTAQSPVGFLFGWDLLRLDCGLSLASLCHGSRLRPQCSLAAPVLLQVRSFVRRPISLFSGPKFFPLTSLALIALGICFP
jgi:hypothetical protein